MAKSTNAPESVSTDVELRISDAQLRDISSFEDAIRLAESVYGSVVDASEEIGSGFVMLENKDRLTDVPFLILSCSFPEGDYRNEIGELSKFAVVRLVTDKGDRLVITDGGHGVFTQLSELNERTGRSGGILVKGGLRRSDYSYEDANGVTQPATTYYLNV